MTRAVLHTNTWVSGLGWSGPPGDVVEAAPAGRFEVVTSPALLDELRRVLAYPKLGEMFGDVDEVIELIALASRVVRPTLTLDLVRDADDNRVLEAAITGSADVIVTGDANLLDSRSWRESASSPGRLHQGTRP
ncbi:MAG: putative toxin-antitoxin system toxin component, PIN family [Actinobacteria bacterium]|nr:putative toxin-antitoxin system toxin component, PIN family [Actinomycetota bacterium]